MKGLILLTTLVLGVMSVYDIVDFGAIAHVDTLVTHFINQKALKQAIIAANSSRQSRVVRIPSKTFYAMAVRVEDIYNVSIVILGKWSASKDVKNWPKQPNSHQFEAFISIHDSSYINISGGGKIDGRGYHWWVICILNIQSLLPDQSSRPHLIQMSRSTNINIHDLTLKNSPQFHIKMDECYDAQLYNINIKVNTTAQFNLLKKFSIEGALILFPLNTDGIDPHGARMHIYNLTVQNFDDVVVPKPGSRGDMDGNCTRDMLVENISVVLGVGMTIGSISPGNNLNCIKNITFRNIYMARPIKGIYVKTNPGDEGKGIVQDIFYSNFTMDRPLWWAIYIGPQQMKEPDGDGPGCMLYPFDKKGTCITQPLVTLRNINLKDIKIHKSLLFPVIIRCNVSNPCTNINFENVDIDEWELGQKDSGYICQFASGSSKNVRPPIDCLSKISEDENKNEKRETDYLSFRQKLIMLQKIQRAVLQIRYEEQDDQFDYSFDALLESLSLKKQQNLSLKTQ